MFKQYYVYMLTNVWRTVLYTGMTNSLERRIWEHRNHVLPGFTRKYNCEQLVYYETYDLVDQAIGREKQIKKWSRAKKNALVNSMNPEWRDLAADWNPEEVRLQGRLAEALRGSDAGDPSPSARLGMTGSGEEDS